MKAFDRNKAGLYLLIIVAATIVYADVLVGPFVLDDNIYIVGNERIRNLSSFLHPLGARYFTDLSFALNYAVFGPDPLFFHLANLIIHIINSVLVFILSGLMLKSLGVCGQRAQDRRTAFMIQGFAALLFCLHPIQTQAVSYITQRYTSLTTLFYLWAVASYLASRLRTGSGRATAYYIGSIFITVLAMKTKEISFTIPFMLLLIELTLFTKTGDLVKRRYITLLPFFITLIIIPVELFLPSTGLVEINDSVSEMMRRMKLAEAGSLSPYIYLITQFTVITHYLKLVIYPSGMRFHYDWPSYDSITEPWAALGLLLLTLILLFALFLLRSGSRRANRLNTVAGFGIVWFFLAISIESSIIPIRDVIFEHRFYLPGVGLFIAISALSLQVARFLSVRMPSISTAFYGLIIITLCSLGFLTSERNAFWANDLKLYKDEVAKAPGGPSPHNYLAMAYLNRNDYNGAIDEFRAALAREPNFHAARNNLALAFSNRDGEGDKNRAMEQFLLLKQARPKYPGSYFNLGVLYFNNGLFDKARIEFHELLRLSPDNPEAIKYLHKIGNNLKTKG